jgi:hypothetical protein
LGLSVLKLTGQSDEGLDVELDVRLLAAGDGNDDVAMRPRR